MGLLDMSPDDYVKQATQYGFGDYFMGRPMKSQAEALLEYQKLQANKMALEDAQRQSEQSRLTAQQQQQYLGSLRQASPGVSPDSALLQGAQLGDIGPTISNQNRIAAPDPGKAFNPMDAIRNGFDLKSAKELAESANWGRAKVNHFQDIRGPNGVQVTGFNEYGDPVQTGQTPWKAPEKIDLGGSVQMYDPVTGAITGKYGKSMTPGEAASNAVAWANHNLSKQNANKSQLVQTDQGFVWADPRSHQIVPATGQDGQPIQPKLKDLPPSIQKTVMENANSLRKVNQALALVDSYPDAFGVSNYLGDTIRQRSDPKGIDARAAVADIGSIVVHDRSGAAVTVSEYPRLAPFVPKATDDAETVKKKLNRFKSEYEAVLSDVGSMYSKDNGYRTLQPGTKPQVDKPAGRQTPSAKPSPGDVVGGYVFKGGDPASPFSWKKQ